MTEAKIENKNIARPKRNREGHNPIFPSGDDFGDSPNRCCACDTEEDHNCILVNCEFCSNQVCEQCRTGDKDGLLHWCPTCNEEQ